ncbi:exopolysaccharide biosynthesis polyprenyl glycosylphosphotransferase [Spirillospora sp. CA-294931]|uniref:exopolysaccharide biosynthesis polyprenyl glycosylphosphotransferase n=1 Tax=Spirillospora sp. CA-294931 TaxID=3240042 RepID=UPI003D8CF81E
MRPQGPGASVIAERPSPSSHAPPASPDALGPGTASRRQWRSARLSPVTTFSPFAVAAADGVAMTVAASWHGVAPAAAAALFVGLLAVTGRYRRRHRPSLTRELVPLTATAVMAIVLATALGTRGPADLAEGALLIGALCCVLGGAARAVVYSAITAGTFATPQPALVIGCGPAAVPAVQRLRHRRDLDLRGQITAGQPAGDQEPILPELGELQDLPAVLASHRIDVVVVVSDGVSREALDTVAQACAAARCETLTLLSSGESVMVAGGEPGHLAGMPCLRLRPRGQRGGSRVAKRAFDVVVATVLLAVASPLLLVCAAVLRCADGPGVIFRQSRIGIGGRPFTLLKFRTLKPADDTESDTRWSIDGDARMGRAGRFLRRTSLDELPQLWNVLRGDMSLVGPRPERPHFVRLFSASYPGYDQRHRVPVGITGWAQVNGLRGNTSIALRARFDNDYIASWSFTGDLKILLMTAWAMVARETP